MLDVGTRNARIVVGFLATGEGYENERVCGDAICNILDEHAEEELGVTWAKCRLGVKLRREWLVLAVDARGCRGFTEGWEQVKWPVLYTLSRSIFSRAR